MQYPSHRLQVTERTLQLAFFCAIGLLNSVFGLGVLVGLRELAGVNYLLAFVVSFIVTSVAGYLLNARFTFGVTARDRFGVVRFMLVSAVMLGATTLALRLLVEQLHLWYLTATVLVAAASAPISFAVQRIVTYRLGAHQRP